MSLFKWFKRKKHTSRHTSKSVGPAKKVHSSLKQAHKHSQHSHNNDPKLTKKERLKVDSDGNVTVPAERTYAFTKNKIKHNGYNPHKDLERRKFLFSKHIVYNPIEANTGQMKRIESIFVNNKRYIGNQDYQIKGDYIKPKASRDTHDTQLKPFTMSLKKSSPVQSASGSNSSNMYSKESISVPPSSSSNSSSSNSSNSSNVSYSDDTSEVVSMAGQGDVSVDQLIKKLKQDTRKQLKMSDSISDSESSDAKSYSTANSSQSSESSMSSASSTVSHSNSDASLFIIKPHSTNRDNTDKMVASLETPKGASVSVSSVSSSSTENAYDWASSKIAAQQKAFKNESLETSSSDNSVLSKSSENSIESSSSMATPTEYARAVASAKSSATSTANYENSVSQSKLSLNYTQKLEASYTAKSKSNDKRLAAEKAKIDDKIKTYKKHEQQRQQVLQAHKLHRINGLKHDIKALETSLAVIGGSEAQAKSASASRASSVSVARSVNAKLRDNNASNSRAMSLQASAYSASSASYEKQIKSYDVAISNGNKLTARLHDDITNAQAQVSSANASLSVLKKKHADTVKDAKKHKALAIAYIKSYRSLMKSEAKSRQQLRQNKKKLVAAKHKNQQLVVSSRSSTDVLKKVSRLNTNVKKAQGQMMVYKGQVSKLRQAYLILKRKTNPLKQQLVEAKNTGKELRATNKDTKKKLETADAKNRKIRAVMHRLYDNNVKGQKKNKTLQKTIIAMHQSSIQTIKQMRKSIHNQEKLKYNQKLLKFTNQMVNANGHAIGGDDYDMPSDFSQDTASSIKDNQLGTDDSDSSQSGSGQHIQISGFKPTHHSFTESGKKSSDNYHKNMDEMHESSTSDSDESSDIPSRSQVHEKGSHGFLSGLFHHHNYSNSPADYYQQNEVHENQRIFLLRDVVQHSSKGPRTLKTGDKLYTTMLMPGPEGEAYKTNFLLQDGTSIPATKRTAKLID